MGNILDNIFIFQGFPSEISCLIHRMSMVFSQFSLFSLVKKGYLSTWKILNPTESRERMTSGEGLSSLIFNGSGAKKKSQKHWSKDVEDQHHL